MNVVTFPPTGADYERAHALSCVNAIRDYWRALGFDQVAAWIEPGQAVAKWGGSPPLNIHSNLIAGLPVGVTASQFLDAKRREVPFG